MARDSLPIQSTGGRPDPKVDGVSFTAMVAANDLQFVNNGHVYLIVKNDGAGTQAATVISVADVNGRTNDIAISLDSGEVDFLGPFPPDLYNQSDGTVHIDSADEDSWNFAAVSPLL